MGEEEGKGREGDRARRGRTRLGEGGACSGEEGGDGESAHLERDLAVLEGGRRRGRRGREGNAVAMAPAPPRPLRVSFDRGLAKSSSLSHLLASSTLPQRSSVASSKPSLVPPPLSAPSLSLPPPSPLLATDMQQYQLARLAAHPLVRAALRRSCGPPHSCSPTGSSRSMHVASLDQRSCARALFPARSHTRSGMHRLDSLTRRAREQLEKAALGPSPALGRACRDGVKQEGECVRVAGRDTRSADTDKREIETAERAIESGLRARSHDKVLRRAARRQRQDARASGRDGRTQILPYQVVAGTKREASSSATASCTSTRGEGQPDAAHLTAARRDQTHQLALAGRVVDLLEAHELGALEQLRVVEGAESASSRA